MESDFTVTQKLQATVQTCLQRGIGERWSDTISKINRTQGSYGRCDEKAEMAIDSTHVKKGNSTAGCAVQRSKNDVTQAQLTWYPPRRGEWQSYTLRDQSFLPPLNLRVLEFAICFKVQKYFSDLKRSEKNAVHQFSFDLN